MKRVAQFSKISFEQYMKDYIDAARLKDEADVIDKIVKIYNRIQLPKRSTSGSAGYDFKCPFDVELCPGESIKIPTGIRVRIDDGWVLKIYPRSSLGFKYRLTLNNTVGIIDSDYFHSSNEGHIHIKMTNCSNEDKKICLKQGDGFAQGIFLEYGITVDDEADGVRNGGIGSTGR